MSYDTSEDSVDQGQPYFLYLFDNGVTQARFTSDAADLTRMGEIWRGSPLSHGEIPQTGNIEKSNVDLTFPLSDTFARTLLKPANEVTSVTVWRGHHTDLSDELKVVWKGRVVLPKSVKQTITISVESIFTSMRRPGCRARYQVACRHSLYFPGCNLNIDDFKIAATVSAISGLELTVANAALQPDGYYKAGVVIFGGLYGWVNNHVGDKLTIIGALPEGLGDFVTAHGSADVDIAPGCDLSKATCNTRFSNGLNNGGFPNMSDRNPFAESIV